MEITAQQPKAEITIQSRFRGAVLGLATGDALGAPAEFLDQETLKAKYGTLTEMVGGGSFGWEPGQWTDDTGMMLCVAEGILESPALPIPHIGVRFIEWRKTTKDCGATCGQAITNYQLGAGAWCEAARNTSAARAGKAAGNGSLMRTLPVALAYAGESEMLLRSKEISAMTHWDAQAEICCDIYCLWVRSILQGADLRSAYFDAMNIAYREYKRGSTFADGEANLAFWNRLDNAPLLSYEELQPSGYAGYCVETLEAVVNIALYSLSYGEAITECVNLAGEADTMAACLGGVLGAYYGVEAIPARWLDKLHKRDELTKVADRLLELRQSS